MAPTGQVLGDWTTAMFQEGHDIQVICSQKSYDGGKLYEKQEAINGIIVQRIAALGFGRKTFIGKLADYLSFYVQTFFKVFFGPRFDRVIILTTPPYLGLLVKIACSLKGTKRIHWIMDVYPDVMSAFGMLKKKSLLYKNLAWISAYELKGAYKVIVLGPDMKEVVGKYVKDKSILEMVPLWGDGSLRPMHREKTKFNNLRGWEKHKFVGLYSGNMGLGHCLEDVLQLTADPEVKEASFHFAFSGGGKRRKQVEDFVNKKSIGNAEMLEYVPLVELNDHLNCADFHFASINPDWNGMMVPSKLQGIFAIGKPVVCIGSEDSSLGQWIKQADAGWIIKPGDYEKLKQTLLNFNDEILQIKGDNARRYSKRFFNKEMNCDKLTKLLN